MSPLPIHCPFPDAPSGLAKTEVAPGILWLRLPLPYSLDHVNVYLIEDVGGWALVDCGLGDEATISLWSELLTGPLAGMRISRLIVTHCHPDHIGAAGWLCRGLDIQVETSFTEFLFAQHVVNNPRFLEGDEFMHFYRDNGLDETSTGLVMSRGHDYLRKITGLPTTFLRLSVGETVVIGGRRFEVLTGGGHSPEQVMLFSRSDGLFFAADQVMLRISPNVSVMSIDPDGDPLGIYLRSLRNLREAIPSDALVLPGHYLPFTGLATRIAELELHHSERCEAVVNACRSQGRSAAELVPFLFQRALDPHQMGFAFSEAMAHANLMLRAAALRKEVGADGLIRFHAC